MTTEEIGFRLTSEGDEAVASAYDRVAAGQDRVIDGMTRLGPSADAAGAALGRLTADASRQATAVATAGDRFVAGLQTQVAAIGKSRSELMELRAAELGVAEAAAPLIARLSESAAAADRAAASERALSGMRAAAQQAERAAYQQAQAAVVAQAKAQDAFVASLEREVAAIGKTRTELLQMQAAQLGVADRAAPLITKLEETDKRLGATGVSAAQTAAAMRTLPAQFTDVFTSLAGGQNVMLVLIQQGGQIKDSFGGVGPALKAVGEYAVELVNPFTLAAAAAATLAFAYESARAEANATARALITSGNAAGVTADQLADMARAGSQSAGTIHANASAISAMVATGKVGAENIQQSATVAIKLERELGIEVGKTAEQFAELAGDPVAASVKLNEKLHYLTASTYEHIKSLADQGRQTAAASAAQQAYATAMETRADQLAANAGTIERAWRGVLGVVKEVGDAMLNIGRKDTIGDQLKAAQQRLTELQGPTPYKNATLGDAIRGAVGGDQELQRQIAVQQALIAGLSKQLLVQDNVATSAAAATAATEARVRLDREGEVLATERVQLERAIARTRQDGITAGWTEAQIQERITALKEKYSDKGAAATAKKDLEEQAKLLAQLSGLTATFSEDWERLGKAFARGGLSADQLATAQAELLSQQPAMREAARAEKERADNSNRAIDAVAKETATLEGQVRAQLQSNEAIGLGAEKVAELEAGRLRLAAAEKASYAAALESARLYAGEYAAAYASAAAAARNQASALYELATAKEKGAALQVTAAAEKSRLEQATRTNEQIAQSLTDALMRGGKSGGDYIKGYLHSLFARPFQVLLQPVANTMGSIATAMTPSGGGTGASSYLNTASSGYNLYAAGSSLYTVGAQYAAGTMSAANAAGTLYGNATAAAYGDGLSALLATNGAYGTAAGASSAAAGTAAAAEGASAAGSSSLMGSFASAGPYAIAALVIANALGLFRTTKQVGGGVMGTVGDTTDIHAYDLMRKSGTLFRGPSYSYNTHAADPALVQAISAGVGSVLSSTRAQASAIGVAGNIATFTGTLGTDTIHPDTGGVGIKLDGLTGEQAQKKVAEAVGALAEKAAAQALGPAGDALARSGETAVQTLSRLSTNLTAANDVLHALGDTALAASLDGATAAQRLTDAFGSTENLASAAGAYYDAIYSDSEKLALAQQHMSESFAELGQAVPNTEADFKRLVDAQDQSTEAGAALWVSLVKLGPAFSDVTEQAQRAADAAREQERAAREQARTAAAGMAARSREGTATNLRLVADQTAAEFSDTITRMLDAARTQSDTAYAAAQDAARAMGQAQAGWMLASKPLSGMALELEKVRANAEALRPALIALYGSTYQPDKIIAKGIAQQDAALKSTFLTDVAGRLMQLTDASAYAAAQLKEEQRQRLADAKALGLSAAEMKKVIALNDAQTAALKEQQVAWKDNAGAQLKSWLDSQRLGAASSLDPTRKLTEAQAQFGSLLTRARASDQNALGNITGAADALLNAGQTMYGSSAQYAALEQMTRRSLESLGAALKLTGFSPAEQRAEMQRQTDWLEKTVKQLEASVRVQAAAATSNNTGLAELKQKLADIETALRLIAA